METMKRMLAVFTAMSLVFAFASCGVKNEGSIVTTTFVLTNLNDEEIRTEVVSHTVVDEDGVTELVTEIVEVTDKEEDTTAESTTKKQSNDPSEWTKEEVVEYYKKACTRSSNVKSTQSMVMRKNSLHAAGGLNNWLKFAEGLIIEVLSVASKTDFDGITGGHQDLVAKDCKTARAYKDGKYIVIEMTLVEQTDGIYGKKNSGTVGHAISVVDGVAEAVGKFPGFDINYKDADIKIHYTNAQLKVRINNKGVIEKGTWSYTVEPVVNDLYIEKIAVNDAGAIIDYAVTVGGGF